MTSNMVKKSIYYLAGFLLSVMSLIAAPENDVKGDITWGTLLICSLLCFIAAEVVGNRRDDGA